MYVARKAKSMTIGAFSIKIYHLNFFSVKTKASMNIVPIETNIKPPKNIKNQPIAVKCNFPKVYKPIHSDNNMKASIIKAKKAHLTPPRAINKIVINR